MSDKQRQTILAVVAVLVIAGAGAYMFLSARKADTSYYNPGPTFKKPSEFPKDAFK